MKDYKDIDLDLYKILYVVQKNGSFSKAAEELNTTQPAISYKIRRLEEILDTTLFIRDSRPLQLTPEAKVLMPYVEGSIYGIEKGIRRLEEYNKIELGVIVIGVPSHISIFLLTDKIKEFYKKYPKIKIKLISKPTSELFNMLKNNELDLIIDSSPFDNVEKFSVKKISVEKCVFACNAENKEFLKKTYTLKDLNNQDLPIIVPSSSSSNTKELRRIYKEQDIEFNPLYEATTSEMIIEMVRQNIGLGYLFEKMVKRYDFMEEIKIENKLPRFDVFLITKDKEFSNACSKFIEMFIK